MNESTPPKQLALKICQIMAEIQRVPKSGRNETQKYDFASESDITDLLRPLMAKHHVCIFVNMDAIEQTEFISKNGAPGTNTKASFTFTLIDADSGESQACQWTAEAMDYQDKGINKVSTAAMKYFLIRTFQISTGDSADDADSTSPEPLAKKPAQMFNQQRPANPARQAPAPVPVELATKRTTAATLGHTLYGNEWETKQVQLCNAISKGGTNTVDGLTLNEINELIEGMRKKLDAEQSAPPAQPAGNPEAA